MKNLESYLESSEIPGCKCKMWQENVTQLQMYDTTSLKVAEGKQSNFGNE